MGCVFTEMNDITTARKGLRTSKATGWIESVTEKGHELKEREEEHIKSLHDHLCLGFNRANNREYTAN